MGKPRVGSAGAFGGPGGGLGGPGGGFVVSSKSSGKATTETIKKKATTRTTKTAPRTTDNETKITIKQNQQHCLDRSMYNLYICL